MKADVKQQWLDALRSGKYEQGQHFLNTVTDDGKHRYCCLGVLCELAVEAGVQPPARPVAFDSDVFGYPVPLGEEVFDADLAKALMPVTVARWADLESVSPNIGKEGEPPFATIANDEMGWDFARIADAIEANIPGE